MTSLCLCVFLFSYVYTGNVYNACDTTIILILYSLKMALGRKFGRTKISTVVERSNV